MIPQKSNRLNLNVNKSLEDPAGGKGMSKTHVFVDAQFPR